MPRVNTARALRRLDAISKAVREQIVKSNLEAAEEVVAQMKRVAPKDTGALAESIVATPGGQMTPAHSQPGGSYMVPENQVVITAGDNAVRYAHLVEWGNNENEPQPFFFPVLRTMKKQIAAKIRRGVRKAFRDAQ